MRFPEPGLSWRTPNTVPLPILYACAGVLDKLLIVCLKRLHQQLFELRMQCPKHLLFGRILARESITFVESRQPLEENKSLVGCQF